MSATDPEPMLERELRTLYEVEPPAWLRARVLGRLGAEAPPTAAPRRRPLRVAALVAALLVLAAACAVALDRSGLLGQTGSVQRGRGTPVDQTVVVSGWRVTLDGAYADANALELFLTIGPDGDAGDALWVEIDAVDVTDGQGRAYVTHGSGSTSLHEGRSSHTLGLRPLAPPLESGPVRISVRIGTLVVAHGSVADGARTREPVSGPWEFELEIDGQGGSSHAPAVAAERDGVTVTLDRIDVAPSSIRAWLSISGATAGVDWMPVVTVGHGPKRWEGVAWTGAWVDGRRDVIFDGGGGGLDDASGTWEVEVSALTVYDDDADRVTDEIAGPWRLDFEVPER